MFETLVIVGLVIAVYALFHISKQLETLSRNLIAIGSKLDERKG